MTRDDATLERRGRAWTMARGVCLAMMVACAGGVMAQSPSPPGQGVKPAEPTVAPAKDAEQGAPPGESKESLPDLDALLKLAPPVGGERANAEAKPANTPETAPAEKGNAVPGVTPGPGEASELEELLSPAETKNEFDQAVRLMGQTATRIEKAGDAGLATQRLQEDVLKRLDKLITSAEKQQQKQSSKSKPSPEQQKQQQQQQQQQKNMAQQSRPQRSQDSSTTAEPPSREGDGAGLTPPTASAPAAWGELPAHVREALLQGSSDRFSSMYRAMTERYYQKLAEEPRK